jgi:hypothetical protein
MFQCNAIVLRININHLTDRRFSKFTRLWTIKLGTRIHSSLRCVLRKDLEKFSLKVKKINEKKIQYCGHFAITIRNCGNIYFPNYK